MDNRTKMMLLSPSSLWKPLLRPPHHPHRRLLAALARPVTALLTARALTRPRTKRTYIWLTGSAAHAAHAVASISTAAWIHHPNVTPFCTRWPHPLPAPALLPPSARRLGQTSSRPSSLSLTRSPSPSRAAAVSSPLTPQCAAERKELRQAYRAVPVPARLHQLSMRCTPAVAPGTPPQHLRLRAAITATDSHSRLHSGEPAQARSHH